MAFMMAQHHRNATAAGAAAAHPRLQHSQLLDCTIFTAHRARNPGNRVVKRGYTNLRFASSCTGPQYSYRQNARMHKNSQNSVFTVGLRSAFFSG
eukprot:COSAG05_NODE_573_length_8601_cov_58.330981_12_plen_95_part_00